MPAKYLRNSFTRNALFPSRDRAADLADEPSGATVLQIDRGTEHVERLPDFKRLRKLSLSSMKEDVLPLLVKMKSLEVLSVAFCNYDDLSPLAKLSKLKCLLLGPLRKVTSLEFLHSMTGLRALEMSDLTRAPDLTPLASLRNLEELTIETAGMGGKQVKVKSLDPIGELGKLKWLRIRVISEDKSLRGLSKLKKLETLSINGLFPWQEYAKLAGALGKPLCEWLEKKYIEWGYPKCRKCGAERAISPPGKGKRAFCGECYPEKVDQLVAEYDEQCAIGASGGW